MIGKGLERSNVIRRKGDDRNVGHGGKKAKVCCQQFGLLCLGAQDKKGTPQLGMQSVQQIGLLGPGEPSAVDPPLRMPDDTE